MLKRATINRTAIARACRMFKQICTDFLSCIALFAVVLYMDDYTIFRCLAGVKRCVFFCPCGSFGLTKPGWPVRARAWHPWF